MCKPYRVSRRPIDINKCMRTIMETDEMMCMCVSARGWSLLGDGWTSNQSTRIANTVSHFMIHILELNAGLEAP